MSFSAKGNALIKNLHHYKEYGSQRLMMEFAEIKWKKRAFNTGSTSKSNKLSSWSNQRHPVPMVHGTMYEQSRKVQTVREPTIRLTRFCTTTRLKLLPVV